MGHAQAVVLDELRGAMNMTMVQIVVLCRHQGTAHIMVVNGVPALVMKKGVLLVFVTVIKALVEGREMGMGMGMAMAVALAEALRKGPYLTMMPRNLGVQLISLI